MSTKPSPVCFDHLCHCFPIAGKAAVMYHSKLSQCFLAQNNLCCWAGHTNDQTACISVRKGIWTKLWQPILAPNRDARSADETVLTSSDDSKEYLLAVQIGLKARSTSRNIHRLPASHQRGRAGERLPAVLYVPDCLITRTSFI